MVVLIGRLGLPVNIQPALPNMYNLRMFILRLATRCYDL